LILETLGRLIGEFHKCLTRILTAGFTYFTTKLFIQVVGHQKFDGPRRPEDDIYLGNTEKEYPPTARVVRIFTSSTFTGRSTKRVTVIFAVYM